MLEGPGHLQQLQRLQLHGKILIPPQPWDELLGHVACVHHQESVVQLQEQ